MNVAIFRDEGKTWEQNKILGDIPGHEYSHTAIEFVGDRVVLGHNALGAIQQITLFDVDWLSELMFCDDLLDCTMNEQSAMWKSYLLTTASVPVAAAADDAFESLVRLKRASR